MVTQPCNTTTFQPGSAGADQNWDFSQLVPNGPQDTTFYISPVGTPYAASYPASNIVARFGADGYGYYQTTSDRLFFWGQSDPSSALVLSDPAVYFQAPTTYGTFILDTIAGNNSLGALSGALQGQVYFQGDGYGDLQTPGGQYTNVLRIKTVTVALATLPFLGTITDSVFNYSWYKTGLETPVLEMIEDTQWSNGAVISQDRYVNFFQSLTTGTAELRAEQMPRIQAFPNPTAGSVQLLGLERPATVTVCNTAGQVVLSAQIDPRETLHLENLAAGLYFCSVWTADKVPQLVKIIVHP